MKTGKLFITANKPKILTANLSHPVFSTTTTRNLFSYWLANLVIFPTYLYCISTLAQSVFIPDVPAFLSELTRIIIWAVGLFPLISILFTPRHWHSGFQNREVLVIISFAVLHLMLIGSSGTLFTFSVALVGAFMFLWLWVGMFLYLSAPKKLVCITFLFLALSFLAGLPYELRASIHTTLLSIPSNITTNIVFVVLACPVTIAFISTITSLIRWRSKRNYWRSYFSVDTILSFFSLGIAVIVWLYLLAINQPQLITERALLGLLALLIAAGPSNFIGRQLSHYRNILRAFRHAQLIDLASPIVSTNTMLNRIQRKWTQRYLTLDNRMLFFTAALLIGGVVIPVLIARSRPETEPTALLLVGVSSSLILFMIYLTFWFLRNRNRYIVTQFEVATQSEDKQKSDLSAIAYLATHMLVEELQQISLLLKLRQIERVNIAGDDNNAFFITSGLEQEFIDQIQQLVNIDSSASSSIALGRLVLVATRFLARMQVRGWVQRRDNNKVELWVELNYRNKKTATVELTLLPKNSIDEIDEKFMRPVARELALRLLVEMNQVSHLGISWQSLDEFLTGLDASSRHNWWEAIAHYRKALQIEETMRRSFGIGHYHLGAALIFQGSWDEGLEHLLTAEREGPPMAETQYMMALAKLYLYWGEIHENEQRFNEINNYCRHAMRLRRHFPEAQQLRALLYYRRGKLQERRFTNQYKVENDETSNKGLFSTFRFDYEKSLLYFANTIKEYELQLRYRQKNSQPYFLESEKHSTLRQRITATHQLADALRSLGRFSEAESYYDDVLTIYPRNLRTLTDLSKTYCLASNWQKAEEFFLERVFIDELTAWDADLSIHIGWALAAGTYHVRLKAIDSTMRLYDKYQASNKVSEALKKSLKNVEEEFYTNKRMNFLSGLNSRHQEHTVLGLALQYIDFALHQRPRYSAVWRQTDWFEPFVNVSRALIKADKRTKENVYLSAFDTNKPHVEHLCCWLALRIESFKSVTLHSEYADWEALIRHFRNSLCEVSAYEQFLIMFNRLSEYRQQAVRFAARIQQEQRIGGLHNEYERLQLAQGLYQLWEEMRTAFSSLQYLAEVTPVEISRDVDPIKPTFAERWVVDLYGETALLTSRMLAEAEVYPLLEKVADTTRCDIDTWISRWQNFYKSDQLDSNDIPTYYTFSPRTLRYQRATLRAWKAYGHYQRRHDFLAKAYINSMYPINKDNIDKYEDRIEYLDDIQADITDARRDIPYHPLAMYVQANVYRERELYSQAIEEYERLLDLISPYDPKQNFGGAEFSDYAPEPTSDQVREYLYYVEKVSGRQQFEDVLSQTNIHRQISNTYVEMKEPQLSVRHLMEAVRWSTYFDLDIDNFLRLANQLNNQERYHEAQAVIDAMRMPSQKLLHLQLSDTKRTAPDVVESVITTRRNQFAKAIGHAKTIAHNFSIRSDVSYKNALEREPWSGAFSQAIHLLNDFADLNKHPETHLDEFEVIRKIVDLKIPSEQKQFRITRIVQDAAQSKLPRSENESFRFPKIFENFQSDSSIEILETQARRARFALCGADMSALLRDSRNLYKGQKIAGLEGEFAHTLRSQIYLFLGKQGRNTILQIAEICNVLAYSRSEIGGLDLEYAITDSITALALMSYITLLTDRNNSSYLYHREKQAQFCDTLGWVHFRYAMRPIDAIQENVPNPTQSLSDQVRSELREQVSAIWKDLERSERLLREGIRYSQRRAIIHYHLAVLYLTRIETIWQANPDSIRAADIGLKAQSIELYLSEAFNHWNNASEADTFGRLHNPLLVLYRELSSYRKVWGERYLKSIAGE